MKKSAAIILLIICLLETALLSQEKYSVATEKIESKSSGLIKLQNRGSYYLAGRNGNALVYQITRQAPNTPKGDSTEAILKLYYDELNKKIIDSADLGNKLWKIRRFYQANEVTLFHGIYDLPKNLQNKSLDELDRGEFLLEQQDIWITKKSRAVHLKSYSEHYYDKDVEYFLDHTGKHVLVSTFVSTYLRSTKADSIINVFDLSTDIENVNDREIHCVECINPQVVNNYIYYGKKFFYMKGADVYDWKIYRAPLFDLSKSELLGEYIELITVSPDGKYILGKKGLHRRDTYVIIDSSTKRFQYLLGNDYMSYDIFYSPGFNKFAFDKEDHIIYVDYPKEFPFSTLGSDVIPKRSSKEEAAAFWRKFSAQGK